MWPVENIYYCDSINIDQKSTTVVGVRSVKEISKLGVSKLGFHNTIVTDLLLKYSDRNIFEYFIRRTGHVTRSRTRLQSAFRVLIIGQQKSLQQGSAGHQAKN